MKTSLLTLVFGSCNYGGSAFEEIAPKPVRQNKVFQFFKNLLKIRKNGNVTT